MNVANGVDGSVIAVGTVVADREAARPTSRVVRSTPTQFLTSATTTDATRPSTVLAKMALVTEALTELNAAVAKSKARNRSQLSEAVSQLQSYLVFLVRILRVVRMTCKH